MHVGWKNEKKIFSYWEMPKRKGHLITVLELLEGKTLYHSSHRKLSHQQSTSLFPKTTESVCAMISSKVDGSLYA